MVFQTLNRLKWKDGFDGVEIEIIHRGAPCDRKIIKGDDVKEVGRWYFVYGNTKGTTIPHHRIMEVRKDDRTIWKRKEKS